MHQRSPLLPFFVHCRSASTVIHLLHRPISHRSPNLNFVYPLPVLHLLQHPASRTVVVHSLNMSKPSQYSLIHSCTGYSKPALLRTSSLRNSIHSSHSHHTAQTLHLKNIHFPLLSTFNTTASAPYNGVCTITSSHNSLKLIYCDRFSI